MKRLYNIAGWLVFAIAFIVYYLSAERTGSLWDCGEFITGAYKLEVVHPPGAPLFMLIGRMFALIGDITSSHPENIAFFVNLMSGVCSAFAAMFVGWMSGIFSKRALGIEWSESPSNYNTWLVVLAVVAAGLTTAFSTSIWFSAVEGEVYAMSTFFTALTMWASVKWYDLPNTLHNDRWLVFSLFAAGLSVGVHLLSLLAFPAIALLYYFKKWDKHTWVGSIAAIAVGLVAVGLFQRVIVTGLPSLWAWFEILTVNKMGLPRHSGIIPAVITVVAVLVGLFSFAKKKRSATMQYITFTVMLMALAWSTYGVIVIRANAVPPINMNNPDDALSLLPYLNREQYGERALLKGPQFNAKPVKTNIKDRYGWTGEKYEYVNQKLSYDYRAADKVIFPRMSDYTPPRPQLYRMWTDMGNREVPTFADNMKFFFKYQINWMYVRYFMWNFTGRQNGTQGYFAWNKLDGNWISGIDFIDNMRLGFKQSDLPEWQQKDKGRNKYFFLPLIFGLIGLFWHLKRRPKDFAAMMMLFLMTGLGIIIYTNQPPNEPRERDYVLVGSFLTFAMWAGMAIPAIGRFLAEKTNLSGITPAIIAGVLVLSAPTIMLTENFDDHSRRLIHGSRDYAKNFLESVEPNSIIFTYGDNDTYPLWYAQEVENIRTDVRVVNLSLIAVDWYIDMLRRKVNDSDRIKLTIPKEAYRGKLRNQIFFIPQIVKDERPMPIQAALKFIGEDHPLTAGQGQSIETYLPTRQVFIPVNRQQLEANGQITASDTTAIGRMDFKITEGSYIIKDQLAVLDVIGSNFGERPIYFAVTCKDDKVAPYKDYLELDGLGLKLVPSTFKSTTNQAFGIVEWGKENPEKILESVNKWSWGNFDKYPLHVNSSYGPALQMMRETIFRGAQGFINEGKLDKATQLVDAYFTGFPKMNFPYDAQSLKMAQLYYSTNQTAKANALVADIIGDLAQEKRFLNTLDPQLRNESMKGQAFQQLNAVLKMAPQMIADLGGDKELSASIEAMVAEFIDTP